MVSLDEVAHKLMHARESSSGTNQMLPHHAHFAHSSALTKINPHARMPDRREILLHSPLVVDQRVYTVDYAIFQDHMDVLRGDDYAFIAINTLWSGICPRDLDAVATIGDHVFKPSELGQVINNEIWMPVLKDVNADFEITGFSLCGMCPSTDYPDMIVPVHVLVDHYHLSWSYDQHCRRHCMIEPVNLPLSVWNKLFCPKGTIDMNTKIEMMQVNSDPNVFRFENAMLFIDSPPNDDGTLNSPARMCMESLRYMSELDYTTVDVVKRASRPPVVFQLPNSNSTLGTFGVDKALQLPHSDPAFGQYQTGNAPELADDVSLVSAQVAVYERARISSEIQAAMTAARRCVTSHLYNATAGRFYNQQVSSVEHETITLAGGVTIGTMPPPILPTDHASIRKHYIANILATFGVPPSLLLGSYSVRSAVQKIEEKTFDTKVRRRRKCLERLANKLYALFVTPCLLERFASTLSPRFKSQQVAAEVMSLDFAMKFKFSLGRLDIETNLELEREGRIAPSYLNRQLVEEYGVEPDECIEKLDVKTRFGVPKPEVEDTKKRSGNGDSGDSDDDDDERPKKPEKKRPKSKGSKKAAVAAAAAASDSGGDSD